jgi:L-alanine-DL-glutamate epimerase-like enolase superfamily enzyme
MPDTEQFGFLSQPIALVRSSNESQAQLSRSLRNGGTPVEKDKIFRLRVSEFDLALWKKEARQANVSVAELIRSRMARAAS